MDLRRTSGDSLEVKKSTQKIVFARLWYDEVDFVRLCVKFLLLYMRPECRTKQEGEAASLMLSTFDNLEEAPGD